MYLKKKLLYFSMILYKYFDITIICIMFVMKIIGRADARKIVG